MSRTFRRFEDGRPAERPVKQQLRINTAEVPTMASAFARARPEWAEQVDRETRAKRARGLR